jgi:hypothetical protein
MAFFHRARRAVDRNCRSLPKPKFKKDDLNSNYIVKSVIPACKDAKADEECY